MKRNIFGIVMAFVILTALATTMAQKADKKWTEWSKKDAQDILEKSPWAQKQTETDASEQMFSPTSDPRLNGNRSTSNDDTRAGQGATNQATNVTYYVRFFSARPIRQALARQIELGGTLKGDQLLKLHNFAEVKSEDSIIVTVLFKGAAGADQRSVNPVMQAFNSAVTGTLKNTCYLQRSDGKQLFLEEYVPPGRDGFGARFIFLRMPNEKQFIDANSKEIRFFAELNGNIKIDRRFKIADMMYQGELEY
ncbi:MAG TPA: hypothetical protein VF397_14930 [Pyrinomonadaceae bacterium]